MKNKKRVMQNHHACYDPELLIRLDRKEHWAIMKLQRYKYVTPGFLLALEYELLRLKILTEYYKGGKENGKKEKERSYWYRL